MKKFSDLGITRKEQPFSGDKISIERILGQKIIIHAFKIDKSKFEGKGTDRLLILQITFKDEKRICWTTGKYILEDIQQIAPSDFPIEVTIMRKEDRSLNFE